MHSEPLLSSLFPSPFLLIYFYPKKRINDKLKSKVYDRPQHLLFTQVSTSNKLGYEKHISAFKAYAHQLNDVWMRKPPGDENIL